MAKDKQSIRLCVAGTPSAGKTFLIHAILKSVNSDRLGEDLGFELHEQTVGSLLPPGQILSDIKTNISSGGRGTAHSTNPKLYEYEYHFRLSKEKIRRAWIRKVRDRVWGRTPKDEAVFRIKNIPGEMFSLYFRHRPDYATIDDLFKNYIHDPKNAETVLPLLAIYKNQTVDKLAAFEELKNDFIKFCDSSFQGADNTIRGDLEEVSRNFYSYLFFHTCTDVLICHDVNLNDSDNHTANGGDNITRTEAIKQNEFLSTIHSQYKHLARGKRLYYAFTKFDQCINEPEKNYVRQEITSIDDYWSNSKELLNNIYQKQQFVDKKIIDGLEQLKKFTTAFPLVNCNSLPSEKLLKYVFFICTNYSNLGNRRGFLSFPKPNSKANGTCWNEHDYLTNVQPLGVLEFIISLMHRSGYYKFKDMNIHLNKQQDGIILHTCV